MEEFDGTARVSFSTPTFATEHLGFSLSRLIMRIEEMLKKPSIDCDLSGSLDELRHKLSESEKYLRNGIFNTNFSEASLFLQNCVALYGKKVDLLWDSAITYQLHLCTTYNKEDDETETDQLEERANRNKRKKVVVKRQKKKSDSKLNRIFMKAEQTLKNCDSTEIYHQFDGESVWEEVTKDIGEMIYRDVTKVDASYKFPTENEIWCSETDEKLCKYKALFMDNTIELYKHAEYAAANPTPASNIDMINRLGGNMNAFCGRTVDQASSSADAELESPNRTNSRCCSVTLKPLPEELLSEYANNNISRVGEIIKGLVHQNTSLSDICRRPSETDSLCHEAHLADDEDEDRVATQRTIDSGIGCSLLDSSYGLSDEDDCIIIDDLDCHEEVVVDEGIALDDELLVPKEEPVDTCDDDVDEMPILTPEVGANETSTADEPESVDEGPPILEKESAVQNRTTDEHNVALFSTRRVIIPPSKLGDYELSKKRKLEKEEQQPKEAKRPKTDVRMIKRLLSKATVVSLKSFENFFLKTYCSQDGEGEVPEPEIDSDNEHDLDVEDILEPPSVHSDHEEDTTLHMDATDNSKDPSTIVEATPQEDQTVPCATIEEEPPPPAQVVPAVSENLQAILKSHQAVSNWRTFIEPMLNMAEQTAKFDIHSYGSEIMDTVPLGGTRKFKSLVGGKSSAEVARYLVATLQLANTSNVELLNTCPGKIVNDELELKLVSRERYHESLDEYEAPSEQTFTERLARAQALNPRLPLHSTPHAPTTSTSKVVKADKYKKRRLI